MPISRISNQNSRLNTSGVSRSVILNKSQISRSNFIKNATSESHKIPSTYLSAQRSANLSKATVNLRSTNIQGPNNNNLQAQLTTQLQDTISPLHTLSKQNNNEMTLEEQLIYDRQIRAWGHETQKELKNQSLVIIGQSSFSTEFAKNLILSGLGSVFVSGGLTKTSLIDLEGINKFCTVKQSNYCASVQNADHSSSILFYNHKKTNNENDGSNQEKSGKEIEKNELVAQIPINRSSIFIIDLNLLYYNLFIAKTTVFNEDPKEIEKIYQKAEGKTSTLITSMMNILQVWLIKTFKHLNIAECISGNENNKDMTIKLEPLIYLKFNTFEKNEVPPEIFNTLIASDSIKKRSINLVRVLVSNLVNQNDLLKLEELKEFNEENVRLSEKFIKLESLQSTRDIANEIFFPKSNNYYEVRLENVTYFDPLTPIFAADMAVYSFIDMLENQEKRGKVKSITIEVSVDGWKVFEKKY